MELLRVRLKGLRFSAAAIAGVTGALVLPASAQADTLREALISAYKTNPTLQGARANQRANDENVAIQKAAGRPSATATATHVEFLRRSANSFTAPKRNFGVETQLTVPLYTGGSVKNGIRAANERVNAGRADLRATESAIFSQVVAAYMDVLRNEALVSLAANQVQVLGVNVQATSDRFEIGDLTRTDVAQSQSRLAVAQGDLRGARANLIGARETYIQLVGDTPDRLEAPPPLPGLPGTVGQAVTVAIENNPDLIAAVDRARAAGIDIDIAGAARLPTVSAFASTSYSNFLGTLGGASQAQFAQSELTANAGVRVSIPLYQGGRPAALERQAQARAGAALETAIQAERATIAQTRSAWSSWQASNAIIESSQTAVSAAELSLEGVRAENSIGNRSILDVLNAEQELLSARVQLVTARRNAYVAGFTLLAAMGKAEARDLNLDTGGPLYDPVTNYDRIVGKWNDWARDKDPLPQSTRTVDIPPANATIGPPNE
ncbi:MAG: TolC family outer membrane protein [Marinomonas sp.]